MSSVTKNISPIIDKNTIISGCTVSTKLCENNDLFCLGFAMAEHTSISEEEYTFPHIYYVLQGTLSINKPDKPTIYTLQKGEAYIVPSRKVHAVHAHSDCIFLQIGLLKENLMNTTIDIKGIFQLKNLIPYQEGKIVNRDLIVTDNTRLAIIALSKGTALSEHAAPNEALLFALEGEAVFTLEGIPYTLKAGDNLAMKKGAPHKLDATNNFKFALLLTK
ncbi:MAG: cupin domain-containing protein [Dialister sp.]|jgi:putative cupin region|nr:cupin domain-containing protein [Dialister sp.]CDF27132.1 putative cupin region [Dialister sp. CAG:588]